MAMRTKKTSLDKRLRELEKESSTLRHEIKSLSRNLKQRDEYAPRSLSDDGAATATIETPAPAMETPTRRSVRSGGAAAELFDDAAPTPEPRFASKLQPLSSNRPKQFSHNAKLGTYLSAGGITGIKPLRQETRVLRNKAIFMLVVVVIMAFIVLKIIF